MKKILGTILKLLIIAIILVVTYYGVAGYKLYRDAVDVISIEDKIALIRSDEDYVTCDEIQDYYLKATIAVEDKRFYEHGALDLISTVRAVITNIKDRNFSEGGSSITQQLAKNMYFSQEKKIERKVAELIVAYKLEDILEKDEILEMYVNVIYFGDGYIGIKQAANGYLDKDPIDLTLYEATLLAGVPNAPSIYAPSNNNDLTYQRQKQVIDCMIEQEYITQDDVNNMIKSDS